MAKYSQALRADLGTVLPSTSEQIGGKPIINHQVFDIKLPLDVHQGQDVYIWNLSYIKWLLLRSHGNENHILPETKKR